MGVGLLEVYHDGSLCPSQSTPGNEEEEEGVLAGGRKNPGASLVGPGYTQLDSGFPGCQGCAWTPTVMQGAMFGSLLHSGNSPSWPEGHPEPHMVLLPVA